MGLNFRKRVRLGKYVNLNLGKTGAGFSFGIPGARISVNSKGRSQASVGLPGTGLYYTKALGTKSKKKAATTSSANANTKDQQNDALNDYNNALFALSHIHTEAYDFFDFETLPIQYVTREIGPLQKQAIVTLEAYKPSFLDRILGRADKKFTELQEKVYEAMEKDDENRTVHTVEANLAEQLQKLQPEAMDKFIEMVGGFSVFDDDVVSLQHSYHMNVDEAEAIIVNVTTNMADDIIDNIVEITERGNYSNKKLSKTAFNERTYAYICSLALGVATEALAITPLYKCYINITDQSTNPATGLKETKVVLAGEFDERQLMQYDYETLNPIDVVEKSSVEMNFTPRGGFKPVAPLKQ